MATPANRRRSAKTSFELTMPPSFLKSHVSSSVKSTAGVVGRVVVLGEEDLNAWAQLLTKSAPNWKQKMPRFAERETHAFETSDGPLWLIMRRRPAGPFSHSGSLEEADLAWFRDQGGLVLTQAKASGVATLEVELRHLSEEAELGFWLGFELAAYSYKNLIAGTHFEGLPRVRTSARSEILREASLRGQAQNLARHLVNLPPNHLNPTSFAQFMRAHFGKLKGMKLEIWDARRLEREGMGLHLGVGQGSPHAPCMIHLRYRPRSDRRPTAFVGKGITFDTGGLDIKPSSGMRLMKKDMGGAASIAGLAWYVAQAGVSTPLDLYLGLAENSVDGRSFRPSDVLRARNGMLVEIHNTDAEGRLVLADVLDVAVTQKGKDEPERVINVATLTGAIKVGLGAEIAGLFSNHDSLATDLGEAGQRAGDLNWRMPLYSRYTAGFSTPFGDLVNATDGFGGAITAALFLEKFVRQKPWAHLDVYAWNDKPQGALTFAGGSGQPVGCLIEFLRKTESEANPLPSRKSRRKK